MNKRIENFIGGKFNKSENDTIPIYNPQEGKIIAEPATGLNISPSSGPTLKYPPS